MHYRFLNHVLQLPFRLCIGDVDQNLQELVSEDEPAEPTSRKIWQLIKVYGCNKERIKAALALVAQASWHTGVAEQQHASGTVVSKYHPEITQDALVIRAYVHTLRHLLPEATEGEK